MVRLTIDDPNELRMLHRMLYARKFDGPDDEYFGSPFIASIQRQLFAALRELDGPSWDEWASARAHEREVTKVRGFLREAGPPWTEMPPDERVQFVNDLLSPLVADPELMADLTSV